MGLVEIVAMNVIRSFLNNAIKNFNDTDLELAIKENKDLWNVTPDILMRTGGALKGRFGHYLPRYFDAITTDLMLNEWLAKDRPDFCDKIKTTPGGYRWFDSQVNKIKKQILEM